MIVGNILEIRSTPSTRRWRNERKKYKEISGKYFNEGILEVEKVNNGKGIQGRVFAEHNSNGCTVYFFKYEIEIGYVDNRNGKYYLRDVKNE